MSNLQIDYWKNEIISSIRAANKDDDVDCKEEIKAFKEIVRLAKFTLKASKATKTKVSYLE